MNTLWIGHFDVFDSPSGYRCQCSAFHAISISDGRAPVSLPNSKSNTTATPRNPIAFGSDIFFIAIELNLCEPLKLIVWP